ncbi:hypothetical protein O1M07_37945 [Streptomyces albulus]|nr:hypothetical protein [Streptomyces noursei]MCZ1019835.1 hypothetical protein [Streptomyces noursei]
MTSPYIYPDDLLQAQRDWYATYRQLAAADTPGRTTALRRRLQRLSVRIATHPYWERIPGRAAAARMALKQAARELESEAIRP